jgi:hypothetical protein
MVLQKSFIHGNSIIAERVGGGNVSSPGPRLSPDGVPWSDVVGLPRGWGKTYKGKRNEEVWFHAAIPTPAIDSSREVRLNTVFLFFETEANNRSFMKEVQVWDGKISITHIQNLTSQGDLSMPQSGVNTFDPREANNALHPMQFGVGISMLFHFNEEAEITFFSAGADFLIMD